MRKTTLTLLGTLAACATAPTMHQFERQAEIPAQFAIVWDALIDTFGENSWPIDTLERDSGIITSDWMRVDPSHMDCGSSGLSTDRDHQVRFNVVVREAAGGSNVRVNTTWQVLRRLGSSPGNWVDCTSRGSIERMVHDAVREGVAAP